METSTTATAQAVDTLRNAILDALHYSPVITAKEWATAVEKTSNCVDVPTLQKWYTNTVAEIARREEAAAVVAYATNDQKQAIVRLLNHPKVSRKQKTAALLGINRLTVAEAVKLLAELHTQTGTAPVGQQLTMPTLTTYAPKGGRRAARNELFRNTAFAHYGSAALPPMPGNEVAFTVCNN